MAGILRRGDIMVTLLADLLYPKASKTKPPARIYRLELCSQTQTVSSPSPVGLIDVAIKFFAVGVAVFGVENVPYSEPDGPVLPKLLANGSVEGSRWMF